MKLEEIVPEYCSKNPFIRKLFLKRLKTAFQLAQPELKSNNNLNIVDLGCGEGIFLKMIEERFKDVKTFGVDIEPNIIELKKFLKAEIKITDIKNTAFPNNFFDIAFCLDVLEHFKNLEKPIGEIKRIIKPGGFLIVSLPTENFFYRISRFLTKGTASEKTGPYCGFNFSPHFQNAKTIEKFLIFKGFKLIKKKILLRFFPLFYIASFKN